MHARLALATLLLAPLAAASAQEIETAQTLKSKRPQAFSAFRAVLPDAYRDEAWAADLDGTSEPLEAKTISGRRYLLGFSCKPHDCTANSLAFLAALDGSRAVVMVQSSERTGGLAEVYGVATTAERGMLKDLLSIPR
jgi:hypothetical protein